MSIYVFSGKCRCGRVEVTGTLPQVLEVAALKNAHGVIVYKPRNPKFTKVVGRVFGEAIQEGEN